jgi:hypothetical protein
MFTNEQIKKLKEDIYRLDNEICELRDARSKEKRYNHIEQCFVINQKINMLRDKKKEIDDELRHDYNEKVGSTFAISDETVKVKRRK